MKVLSSLLIIIAAMFISVGAYAQVEGTWLNQDATAHIEMYKNNGKWYGKIIWLKEPNDEAGKPKTDPLNPNAALRTRPRLGMIAVSGFKPNGANYWDGGEIYNPKKGKTYSCNMTLQADGKLKLRGYIGISLIGETQIWTRVK